MPGTYHATRFGMIYTVCLWPLQRLEHVVLARTPAGRLELISATDEDLRCPKTYFVGPVLA